MGLILSFSNVALYFISGITEMRYLALYAGILFIFRYFALLAGL